MPPSSLLIVRPPIERGRWCGRADLVQDVEGGQRGDRLAGQGAHVGFDQAGVAAVGVGVAGERRGDGVAGSRVDQAGQAAAVEQATRGLDEASSGGEVDHSRSLWSSRPQVLNDSALSPAARAPEASGCRGLEPARRRTSRLMCAWSA